MSDPKFLIDVNLPYYFSIWRGEEYVHQIDLGDDWTDARIWEYAESRNLTIVTKDSDFSNRMVMHTPPPKVIHIRIGNVRMQEFYQLIERNWNEVVTMNARCKLVNVFIDRIEGLE